MNMSRILKTTFLALMLNWCVMAQAQIPVPIATLNDVVSAIDNLRFYIASAVNSTFQTMTKLWFEQNPNQEPTVKANTSLDTAQQNTTASAQSLSPYEVEKNLHNRNDALTHNLAAITASDIPGTTRSEPGNSMMSSETLLGPLVYNGIYLKRIEDLEKIYPYNFIQLASGAYQPISTVQLDPTKLSEAKIQEITSSPNYKKLQTAIRAYVAAQSVGANNLYQMMIERLPQGNLGKNSGLVDKEGKPIFNASPLQVKEFLATRRSQNPAWYRQMADASPATVQRETLFVLAEIRQQLFEMQQQNERLLATLSVMQMQQNSQITRMNIMQPEQAVESAVRDAQGLAPEGSTLPKVNLPTQ